LLISTKRRIEMETQDEKDLNQDSSKDAKTADEFFKAATHSTDDAPPKPPGPAQATREVIGLPEENLKETPR
jgi:hypothetical protein